MSASLVTPELLRRWPIAQISASADKEARGRVLVIGGSAQVAGATVLSGIAALRVGAGKLQIGAPSDIALGLALSLPEARVIPLPQTPEAELSPAAAERLTDTVAHADAIVVGPGMLDEDAAGELALRLVSMEGPAMVLDAAAMVALAGAPERAAPRAGRLVLTPHAGEMATLTGRSREEIEADPETAARDLAVQLHAVVALKGPQTFILSPDGQAWRFPGGGPGLATSGSGDVLSGIVAGLLARGAAPAQAAVWGVYIHGACGRALAERIAPVGFLARELLDEIPAVVRALGG